MKTVTTQTGKRVTLLNPGEKSAKYAAELRNDMKITNDFKTMKQDGLTDTERAYRSGYLACSKDSAKLNAWKEKKGYIKPAHASKKKRYAV